MSRQPLAAALAQWRWAAGRWSIRTKLIAILLIPTVAALLLGALRVQAAAASAASYARVEALATAARDATVVIHGLQTERDLAAGFTRARRPDQISLTGFGHNPARVDRAAAWLRASLQKIEGIEGMAGMEGMEGSADADFRGKIRTALGGLDRLSSVRQSATSVQAQPPAVFRDYTTITTSLLAVVGEVVEETAGQAEAGEVANPLFALESLATAKESASRVRAAVYGALVAGHLDRATYSDLAAARAQHAGGVAAYLSHASPAQQERYRAGVGGAEVDRIEQIVAAALADRPVKTWGVSGSDWFPLASRQIDQLRQIEAAQTDDITTTARQLASAARKGTLVSMLLIGAILAFAALAMIVIGRWIVRPLRTLRSAALNVAQRDLPETVRRLQERVQPDLDLSIRPVAIHTQDEIGEVARAFDAVHEQAVRLAGEQALLRGNVNGMFVNLARRSQTLVERQLRLIDDLESGEQDPDRLANLFQLDHLATRMRRNDENLLVLAGTPAGRRRNEPVPLVDVVRAASAEVEQYSRVQIDVQPGHEVISPAVNDTIHLIAELLENATAFSPPHTAVRVRALGLRGKDDALVEIEDEGIGMSPEELAKANEKLASPDAVDVATSPMMGLYVVARLARRQGIQVQLRASQYGGVTALVRLPAAIIRKPAAEPEPVAPRHRLIPEEPSGPLAPPPSNGTGVTTDPRALTEPTPQHRPGRSGPDSSADLPPAPPSDEPERSPIFDALQSEWFRPVLPVPPSRRPYPADADLPVGLPDTGLLDTEPPDARLSPRPDPDREQPVPQASAGTAADWSSPGDEGWRAVAALSTQPAGGLTSSGLPLRIPGRNLVPGSARSSGATPSDPPRTRSHRDPEDVRRLSAYQQGVDRARAAGESAGSERPDRPLPDAPEEPS